MEILFERSGGIMGLRSSLSLNLDEVPIDQARTLRLLLDKSQFLTLPENPPTRSPVPDGFQYTVTIKTETITHTVHTNDANAPDELRPLLEYLAQKARPQPKLKP